MKAKYVEMRAVGLTVDAELKFPLLMLKNDANGRVFPLSLDAREKNFLLNTLMNRRNLYAGVIRGLIDQRNLRPAAITLDEDRHGELTARVTLKGPRRAETVTLAPKEGVVLAMEYGVPVRVAGHLLDSPKYYTRSLPAESPEKQRVALFAEPWFADDDEETLRPTGKEETLQ